MKNTKTKSLTVVILMLFIILLNGCKKDITTQEITSENTQEEISNYADSISKAVQSTDGGKVGYITDRTMGIIKADVEGALVGARVAFGWTGNIHAAIGGAALLGGLTSYAANKPVFSYDECGNQNCMNCNGPKMGFFPNRYDQVGVLHNELIIEALQNRNRVSNYVNIPGIGGRCNTNIDKGIEYFTEMTATNLGMSNSELHENAKIEERSACLKDFLKKFMFYPPGIFKDIKSLEYLEEKKDISSFAKNVLITYFTTFRFIKNYNDFFNYTITLERILILNEEKISKKDFETLMIAFSVSRHSAGLWATGTIQNF